MTARPELEPIRRIAVIGAGRRGTAFALRCAMAGYAVVLEDVLSSNLRKAQEEIEQHGAVARSQVRLANSVEDAVREADLAVDFVPDELESKLEIFSMMDRMAPPRTILCTPTTLSISDLASCTYRPGECVALVGFAEDFAGEVEVVRTQATTAATLARVVAWIERLGASARVVKDDRAPLLVRNAG